MALGLSLTSPKANWSFSLERFDGTELGAFADVNLRGGRARYRPAKTLDSTAAGISAARGTISVGSEPAAAGASPEVAETTLPDFAATCLISVDFGAPGGSLGVFGRIWSTGVIGGGLDSSLNHCPARMPYLMMGLLVCTSVATCITFSLVVEPVLLSGLGDLGTAESRGLTADLGAPGGSIGVLGITWLMGVIGSSSDEVPAGGARLRGATRGAHFLALAMTVFVGGKVYGKLD